MATTRKMNDPNIPILSGVGSEYIVLADSSGKMKRVSLANLKASILGGANFNDIYDNVFIACHRKSDGLMLQWRPEDWPAQQNAGEVADGVALIVGDKHLLVAPTEADSNGLIWSSAAVSGGGTTTTARLTAQQDFNGKANTAAQIGHTECQGTSYAPGFCAAYSRSNGAATPAGVLAGQWWLPSLGELYLIFQNYHKINYALSLITGAVQLPAAAHWSSTEYSATYAWGLYFRYGDQYNDAKASRRYRVRPVSAF